MKIHQKLIWINYNYNLMKYKEGLKIWKNRYNFIKIKLQIYKINKKNSQYCKLKSSYLTTLKLKKMFQML